MNRNNNVVVVAAAAAAAAALIGAHGAHAQDDHAAGLFCEARQLPLVSQAVRVDVRGPDATLTLEQTFKNDGADVAQADFRVPLPEGASVVGFGFWKDGRLHAATLQEKQQAEANHARAASEGRTTGLASTGVGALAKFSVYPVPAGSEQRVQLVLKVPVSVEAGRSHVRVPIDAFLGQPGPSSTVLLDLRAGAAVANVGADGASLAVVKRSPTSVLAATAARRPVDLWWGEEGAPLVTRASSAPLGDGSTGVEVLVRLNDASSLVKTSGKSGPLTVLVDGSASMASKSRALDAALERLGKHAAKFVVVADRRVNAKDAAAAEKAVLDHAAGHRSTWAGLEAAAAEAGCATSARCVAVVDGQLDGIAMAVKGEVPVLVLASADEAEWKSDVLTRHALVARVDVDPESRVLALADETALSIVNVTSVGGVDVFAKQPRQAAEGGMVRLIGTVPPGNPLPKTVAVAMLIDGVAVTRTVDVIPAQGDEMKRVRRASWEQLLDLKVAELKKHEEPALRKLIVDTSVAEGIPTELTALQVDVPEPSMPFVGSSAPEPASWAAMMLIVAAAVLMWRRASMAA